MDTFEKKQKCIQALSNVSTRKGYITFDDIIDAVSQFGLPIDDVERVSGQLISAGCIIRENANDVDMLDDELSDRSRVDYAELYQKILDIEPELEPYINEVSVIPAPQSKEVTNLIFQAQEGNTYAKNRIIMMYLRVVIRTAYWAHGKYDIPISDAIQHGNMGLVLALDKYDPLGEQRFDVYAPWWIRQQIARSLSSFGDFYIPVHLMDKLTVMNDVTKIHFCERCYTEPCPNLIQELCNKLSADEDTINRYLTYMQKFISLEEILGDEQLLTDGGSFDENMIDRITYTQLQAMTAKAMSSLTVRERQIIEMRFGFNGDTPKTLEEIGQIHNVTRERIRQIEAKAIRKLRHPSRSKVLKCFYTDF